MILTYNETLNRYEFRCTREERDKEGRLALGLAGNARFQVALGTRDPLFITTDPFKAQALSAHGDEELRKFIAEEVARGGGGVPVMTLISGVYIWTGPPEANGIVYNDIPKNAGLAFTRTPWRTLPRNAGSGMTDPCWYTEQSVKAQRCMEYADEMARESIKNQIGRREKALEASRATDSDIEIPVPPGLVPFGYQKAGVAYFSKRSRVLCGDEMGLGKTVMGALWINYDPTIKRVLVVCPASLKRNWQRELQKWLVRKTTVGIADTRYPKVIPSSDIVIINYDILARREDTGTAETVKVKTKELTPEGEPKYVYRQKKVYEYHMRESLKRCWDLVIVDEVHKCKGSPETVIRSRMVYSLEAERVLFLTGTPIVNRPRELWHMIHYLAPKQFPEEKDYLKRYCKGDTYMDPYAGGSNLSELQQKLRLWILIRRLKRDVLKDLPPKMRQVIELPADSCEGVLKSEKLAFEKKEDVLTAMRLRVELAKASDSVEDYKQAVATLTAGIKVAFEDLSRIRKETALAKVPMVIEHLQTHRDENHKVICFAHHKEVIAKLAEAFAGQCVTFTGASTLTQRDEAVCSFQQDPSIWFFFGTIGAAGVGLTLTASSYVVFAELDWVPGNVTQAEDRAHRIGQSESVLIQHLVLEGSMDQRMAEVLVEKQDMADRALDREDGNDSGDILTDPVMPDREKMATMGVTPKEIAKLADKMTPADIAAVHMGVRMLAGRHKDSSLLDGATFRDVDAPLGKVLAETRKLTPKLGALGKKLLSKYRHTQLGYMPEIQQLFGGNDETKTK